jgi:hypothetical protein
MVLRERRPSGEVVEPVVEGPDPAEEEDRTDDHAADEQDDLRVPHRIPAPPEAEQTHERSAETEAEDGHPGAADEAGPEHHAPYRAARRLEMSRVLLDLLGMRGRHAF